MLTWTIEPVKHLGGEASLPGDKSISHRALIHAALAKGTSRITGFLQAGVTEAMLRCVRALGVEAVIMPHPPAPTWDDDPSTSASLHSASAQGASLGEGGPVLLVHGEGMRSPEEVLDCGNSGGTVRMMLGALAGRADVDVTLSGSDGLRRRPMLRVIAPLRQMGAHIAEDALPVTIHGRRLHGIDVTLPVASAQLKAALLLAALQADGPTTVHEPGPSRDHSERLLRAIGVPVVTHNHSVTLEPIGELPAFTLDVPGDLSSAAFVIAAAVLAPDSDVTLRSVGVNSTRTGLLDALAAMGAAVTVADRREVGGEPVADVNVRSSALRGITLGGDDVVRMIDEFPIFAVIATQAEGQTVVRDAAELRVKESDRIGALVAELRKLGARIEERPDGFVVDGPARLRGARVDSHGDHRLAMSLAVAGLIADGETTVLHAEAHRESFPNFAGVMRSLGARFEEKGSPDIDENGTRINTEEHGSN